jgi:hypothetical protein
MQELLGTTNQITVIFAIDVKNMATYSMACGVVSLPNATRMGLAGFIFRIQSLRIPLLFWNQGLIILRNGFPVNAMIHGLINTPKH